MKILITGATSGIAFLTGCVLISRGHNVYMTTKTEKEANNLREKIELLNLKANIFKLDIKDDFDKIKDLDLDVLYLHAGIGYTGKIKNMNVDLIRDNFEVNVFSNLKMIQTYLNSSKKDKKIVMTSSLLANHSLPYFSSYIMTKTCIDIIINTLRKEELFSNNKFILIKPGAYHTGFNQYMISSGEDSLSNLKLDILNKIFKVIEVKELNSIVYKIIEAIEIGNKRVYSAPLIQNLFMKTEFYSKCL